VNYFLNVIHTDLFELFDKTSYILIMLSMSEK